MQELKFVRTEGARQGLGACCGPNSPSSGSACCPTPSPTQPFVAGTVPSPVGPVPKIATAWSRADHLGMIRSRIGAYRMRYTVEPGLYAVGGPGETSDVFVTANYKLSFDILRRSLAGMHAWVLVLDTKSINVWCAAGKGTFGTEELVRRTTAAQLERIVSHRRLVLPQLGAVGVNAAEVRKRTGFRVHFGPVRAEDIAAYVQAGYAKTEAMRTIRFPLIDRLILTPMELNPAFKKYPWFAGAVLLLFGIQPSGVLFADAFTGGMPFLLLGAVNVVAGAFVTPVLLPFVPFRSFALKGAVAGLVAAAAVDHALDLAGLVRLAAYLLAPAMTSYIALQFTGSTTFTGMSGVKRELRYAVPCYLLLIGGAVLAVMAHKLRTWGVV